MIADRVENLSRYGAMHPALQQIADFLRETDVDALPTGRIAIDGSRLYVLVQRFQVNREDKPFEVHARYADVQLVVHGRVGFGWSSEADIAAIDPEKDIGFGETTQSALVQLQAGEFILFEPGEAHAPDQWAGEEPCMKRVFKVLGGE